jgi:serine/threonine-protein kinase
MIGTNLSHYRITDKLGAGGMGEVYRAEDTNLNRQVAIKVLPDIFASDPERLARFEREAKLLASLNHPNIASIYGLEEHEGKPFLVLELVEGQTLAERLKKGRIPLDETLDICRQIAEGLEAAHEKGVIHRDLKPSNVKVTPEGKVKVLDFGLAKAFQGEPSAPDVSKSPTLTNQMTHAGVILGTAAYMSPEQTKGKAVDKRADIWGFGCVLYECLTGKRVFEGETVTETMAAILMRDPAWEALPAATPGPIKDLLRRCLQRDTQLRLRDIGDALIELRECGTDQRIEAPHVPTVARFRLVGLLGVLAILGFGLAGLILWGWSPWKKSPEVKRIVARLSINLPSGAPLAPTGSMPLCIGQPSLALSPDGRYLAYVALVGLETELHLRDMGSGEYRALPGTKGARTPFFSPDGQWVAFFAGEKLKKVALAGGESFDVASTYSLTAGGAWGSDNYIYYNPDQFGSIRRVPAAGGQVEILYPNLDAYGSQAFPAELPGGQSLVANINLWPGMVGIVRKGVHGDPKLVLKKGSFARYIPTGHLIYAIPGKLMAINFDLEKEDVVGDPMVLFDDLRTEGLMGAAQFSVSSDGTLVYARGVDSQSGAFVWVDRFGNKEAIGSLGNRYYGDFKLSPDGRQLALTVQDVDGMDIWIHELERGTETRFTSGGWNYPGAWLPDSKSLIFGSQIQKSRLFWKARALNQEAKPLPKAAQHKIIVGFRSGDRDLILNDNKNIFVLSTPKESGKMPDDFAIKNTIPVPFMSFIQLSPDGCWLAYTSIESGRWAINVCSFPDIGRRTQISTRGGEEPRWNPNGREIVYRWGSQWFSVDITLGPEIVASAPKLLFQGPYINVAGYDWDISPDGKRFLVIENPQQDKPQTELAVITNLFDLLQERLPTKQSRELSQQMLPR